MIKLKVINKSAIKLHCCDIISFEPNIIIKIKNLYVLRELLINKNYEICKKFTCKFK
jgi:hypothetical protein